MGKQVGETMIEAGKATAAPPLGPALGPTGVNIGKVVADINQKTADMKGMQVPVKVIIDTVTKEYMIEIGTPPSSALIKKEAGIEKGSGSPLSEKVADLMIEQIIKIAKIKEGALLGKDLKAKVKEVIGTCQSMGILVEGMPAPEALEALNSGKFDHKIKSGKTELTAEEKRHLEEEKHRLKEEMEKRRAEFEAKAKDIIKSMEGKEAKKIRTALAEAGIPAKIIDELAPAEKKEAAPGAQAKK